MHTLEIDGKEYTAHTGQTVLDAARAAGVFIPSLCYSADLCADGVNLGGGCGLCLVEVASPAEAHTAAEYDPRPVRACNTRVVSDMRVRTDTPALRAMQRRIAELMLSEHIGDCAAPCRLACPAETDCAAFIKLAGEIGNTPLTDKHREKLRAAVKILYDAHPFPLSISYICPRPCESACRRAVRDSALNIAGLKRWVLGAAQRECAGEFSASDCASSRVARIGTQASGKLPPTALADGGGKTAVQCGNIAVLGGGPAGLTAAYFLRRGGCEVTVYDRAPQMGGLLRYGIPEFRLPKAVLDKELRVLEQMGIRFVNGGDLAGGASASSALPALDALRANYTAVVIAVGASRSKKLGCAGDDLPHVMGGVEYLRSGATEGASLSASDRVVVIGGSNTAMDAARTALRRGARVTVAYRRTRAEMPARPEEIAAAESEGVQFKFLRAPLEVTSQGVLLQCMELGAPDASGRRAPVAVAGSEEFLPADLIISAIGQEVDTAGLEALPLTRWGTFEADAHFETPLPGVYAIGDATGQSAFAIEAIAHARRAAAAILRKIAGEKDASAPPLPAFLPAVVSRTAPTPADLAHIPAALREEDPARAANEAARCLQCGCGDLHKCQLVAISYRLNIAAPFPAPPRGNPAQAGSITHDVGKCILCGLCVRACDALHDGQGILSFAHRGRRTRLCTSQLNSPICENKNGASCTECADICPTGAMTES